jgi:sarcosine oxidase/L-pipecolate oxidase
LQNTSLGAFPNKLFHVIVGGGTFGLSTAYHLAKSGNPDVTVIDKSEFLPSEASDGNDVNKIIPAA